MNQPSVQHNQPPPPSLASQEKKTHTRRRASQNPRTLATVKMALGQGQHARVKVPPPKKNDTHTTAKVHDLCSTKEASASQARGLDKHTHHIESARSLQREGGLCQLSTRAREKTHHSENARSLQREGGLCQPSTRAGINLTAF